MDEVAVRHVDLDAVGARADGAAGGLAEGGDDPLALFKMQGARRRVAGRERNRRGRADGPAALLGRDAPALLVPRARGARLAAGVVELHDDAAPRLSLTHEGDDLPQARLALVGPEPEVSVRDAPFGRHGHRLDADEARAGGGEASVVHLVKKLRDAASGAVHAHGRHRDAVGDLEGPEADRREELGFHFFILHPPGGLRIDCGSTRGPGRLAAEGGLRPRQRKSARGPTPLRLSPDGRDFLFGQGPALS